MEVHLPYLAILALNFRLSKHERMRGGPGQALT